MRKNERHARLAVNLPTGGGRMGQLRNAVASPNQKPVVRYNFGTTEGEISGERIRKRRSAKHLEFLPSLLEGRRSFQLSYGRIRQPNSKSFVPGVETVLGAMTLCAKGGHSPASRGVTVPTTNSPSACVGLRATVPLL